jgi:hypothetical protein
MVIPRSCEHVYILMFVFLKCSEVAGASRNTGERDEGGNFYSVVTK